MKTLVLLRRAAALLSGCVVEPARPAYSRAPVVVY
jgi:hypothetical protein